MKFTLVALIAATAALAVPASNGNDKVYISEQDLTCYKVVDGEHSAHLDCKSGHLDNAPVLNLADADDDDIDEVDDAQDLEARGSCMLGLWACKLSCKNMGCGGGRCRKGRRGVCSCSC